MPGRNQVSLILEAMKDVLRELAEGPLREIKDRHDALDTRVRFLETTLHAAPDQLKEHDRRIGLLERAIARIAGAAFVGSVLGGALLSFILNYFRR